MTEPTHQEYDKLRLEFSTDGGTTWAKNCIIKEVEVTRKSSVSETETVADCDDESLPYNTSKRVMSIAVSVTGTGNWTRGGYNLFLEKFYAGDSQAMLGRICNLSAAPGEIEYETGPIIVSELGQARKKGGVVTAAVTLDFAETPTRALKV